MRSLGKFLEGSIHFWVLLEKGVVEFQIHFFLGGNPKKRESGDLRLLWFFQDFFRRQALEKGIRRFEIALRL